MNSMMGKGLSFAGHPRDGPAQDYIDVCKALTAMAGISEGDRELITRCNFVQGLKGKAARWYEDLDYDQRKWDKEVYSFKRETGESLIAYIKRAEDLANKVKPEDRQTLLTNFISQISVGDVDLRLQERVVDRLFASDKWTQGVASKELTMADVKVILYDCRTSASEKIVRQDEDSVLASGLDPVQMILKQQEEIAQRDDQIAELLKHLDQAYTMRINSPEQNLPYSIQYGNQSSNYSNNSGYSKLATRNISSYATKRTLVPTKHHRSITMTQKAAKRKRKAQAAEASKKVAKTTSIVTPPPDATTPFEPKNLQTVISDEELDITVETLTTLAQYPNLTKSKLCKNLRVAVYDFRQSCNTGVNSAEGANLTARVTAALADEKFLEAKILLAEMRLRREEPKLGALCRWVRDLDVVTQPNGASIVNPDRSAKEKELLEVLDAVLRVSCPIDYSSTAELPPQSSSHIALQAAWDLRSSTDTHQVYASVLDKSILSSGPASLPSSLRIIETTPGHLRKPPNHHPAILYTTEPNTVDLSPNHGPITFHNHPNVPHLSLATGVLSPDECKAIIAAGESVGFLPDVPVREDEDVSILAHNFYWVCDTAFHDKLWARMAPFIPASLNGRLARGLNRRFRVYRYVPGAEYRCHIDGAWPPSGIRADDTYMYDSSPADKKQSSLFTFLLYLNDEFEGGETMFYMPATREGTLNAYPVRPVMGAVAVFPHGESKGALLHEGTSVRKGAKYIIRTDIEYDVEPSQT
ncbi:hypothetical protein QQS21_000657 [Conoideocrella luteorostrata]|uniref:Fe2OG dioxygenase domain-containing protein n=1 Tax=Conoideocrella luteorostrata TaxID=1105319 RepID=A0AAJ0FZ17_9HYPO|nr:hypothetical protein QQS21_000657 [Conoideocrella luteorostrata]